MSPYFLESHTLITKTDAQWRELLQAKTAFEAAKEAQDSDKVGRILTYVEGKLKK